jgi:hypothetical protein
VNPWTYQFTPSDPVTKHVCAPVSFGNIEKMVNSLTYNTYFDKFMMVGVTGGNEDGRSTQGIWYSLSDNLVDWSPRRLIVEAELPWTYRCDGGTRPCNQPPGCTDPDTDPVLYPSIVDPSSSSKNFETSDQNVNLYFTEFNYANCGQNLDRDLIRIPIRFQKSRVATLEDGALFHPTTGFDSGNGQLQLRGAGTFPGAYEGTEYLRAIYFNHTGSAQGQFEETLPNGTDVWYGAAFYLNTGFATSNENVALLQWSDPAGNVHGGVSLRSTDDQHHVVRGNTANPGDDTNVGPAFSLPEGRWFWLEVHQRLDQANPLTEVFRDGHLISTSAAQNNYPDSAGVPSRLSYGIGANQVNAFDLYVDRASVDVRQRGAVGAPSTPTGLNGTSQDRMVTLWWNASVGATKYRVYMDRHPVTQVHDGTWHWIREVTTTALFQTNLTNCLPYKFRVAAVNSDGLESVVSAPLALTPKAAGQQC